MIQSALKRIFQLIFILMIGYAGSFVVMEESSEKTEKTEKSEEALYSLYHSKKYSKSLDKSERLSENQKSSNRALSKHNLKEYHLPKDFNINFIYYTSYLDYTVHYS